LFAHRTMDGAMTRRKKTEIFLTISKIVLEIILEMDNINWSRVFGRPDGIEIHLNEKGFQIDVRNERRLVSMLGASRTGCR
jgi:hypothetical protein